MQQILRVGPRLVHFCRQRLWLRLLSLTVVLSGLVTTQAWAASGIFEGYVVLNTGSGPTFYDLNGTTQNTQTANPDFNGSSLGTFAPGGSLLFRGGQLKTFKNSGCDVTGANMHYRVYPAGLPAGSFTVLSLAFDQNLATPGDQQWTSTGYTNNLLTGLTAGDYVVEVYGSSGYQSCGTGTNFYSDGGTNYRATFRVANATTTAVNEGFELAATSFTLVNGNPNEWVRGNAAGGAQGSTNALYVSNNGASYAYSGTNNGHRTQMHAYTDIAIGAGQSLINLSFDWKNVGELNFDYLRVSYAPTTFTPASVNNATLAVGAPISGAGTGTPVILADNLVGQAAFATRTIALPASLAGTSVRLIFTWANDASIVNNPPAAFDNVVVTTQAALNPICGTKSVGPGGDYASLTSAFATINANGLCGPVVLELLSNYLSTVESFPLVFSYGGTTSVNTVTVRPRAGATGLSISSAASQTLSVSGGSYFILDGRPGGSGAVVSGAATTTDLTIANTSTTGIPLNFTADATFNTVQHCQVQGVGSTATFPDINFAGTAASGNSDNLIRFNTIGSGASTPTTLVYSASSLNARNTIQGNDLQNFYNAADDAHGIFLSAAGAGWIIRSNSLYWTASRAGAAASTLYGINIATGGSGCIIEDNFIGGSSASASGAALTITGTPVTYRFRGISLDGSGTAASIQNNTIANFAWLSSSGATGAPGIWAGMYLLSNANVGNEAGNTIGTSSGSVLVTSSTGGGISYGIVSSAGPSALVIARNTISNLTAAGTTATVPASFAGIQTAGTSNTIARNKIYGLTAGNNGVATGIIAFSGTSTEISNNLIGDLRAPISNSALAVAGITVAGGSAVNIYHNTLYLNASSTGTAFGSSGIYLATTTTTADLRNNIVVNASTPGSSGLTVALRRTSAALTGYASTSDHNLYYAGTPAASRLLYYDGTNSDQTLAAFKARVTTRESGSVTENVPFASTSGAAATYLHIAPTVPTLAESNGVAIAGFTDDYDASGSRSGYPLAGQANGGGTAPDLGADEGDFTPRPRVDVGITALVAPAANQACYTPTETVTVTLKNFASTQVNFASTPVTVSGTITAPGFTTITLPAQVISSGTLASNATQDVTFAGAYDLSAPNTYTFNITTTADDTDVTNDALPGTPAGTNTRVVQPLAAGTASASPAALCGTTSNTTLTLTGSTGGSIQWQASTDNMTFANISGATTATYATAPLAQTTYFRAQVSCNATTATSNVVTVTVSDPQITAVNAPTRCGEGTVTLEATANAGSTPFYFTTATGGTAIASGASATVTVAGTPATQTYYVEARAAGCTSTSRTAINVTVTAPPALTPATSSATICDGASTSITYSGYANLTVSPTTGASVSGQTVTFTPTTTTNYTITGNDGTGPAGCSNTATATITVNPTPNAPTLTPASPAAICVGSSTSVTASVSGTTLSNQTILATATFDGGTNGFTTTSTGSQVSAGFTRVTAGYLLNADNTPYNGPSGAATGGFYIADADKYGVGATNPSAQTTLVSPAFSTVNFTAATLSFQQFFRRRGGSADIAEVEYSTNGSTWATLISYTSSQGSLGSQSATTIALPAAALNQSSVQIRFRYQADNGWHWAIDNVGITGTITYATTFAVTPASGASVSGSTITFNPTTTTTYNVTASYAGASCPSPATPITITVNPRPTAAFSGSNASAVCANSGTTLTGTLTGTAPFSGQYQVNGGPAQTLSISGNTFSIVTGNLTANTTYTISALSDANCAATTLPAATATVTVRPRPTAAFSGSNVSAVCANSGTTLTGTLTGTAPFTGQFTVNGGPAQTLSISGNTFSIVTGNLTANTTYAISALSDANCAATTLPAATTTITVRPRPTAAFSGSNASAVCTGTGTTLTGTLTGTAPFSGQYQVNGGPAQALSITGSTFSIATGNLTANTTYTISALSDANCAATTLPAATATVTVNPRPTAAFSGSNASAVCANSGTTLTGTLTGTAPFTGQFTVNGGPAQTLSTSGNTFSIATGNLTANTTYTITALSDANCAATTLPAATTTITVNSRPTFTISNVVQVNCRGASTGSIEVLASGGVTPYRYSRDNGVTYQVGNTFNGLPAGTYQILVRSNNGALCPAAASQTVTITQPATGVAVSETHTDVTCTNANDGTITAMGSQGVGPYRYSINGGTDLFPATPTSQPYQFVGLAAGAYQVLVRDANGCTASTPAIIITTNPRPTATLTNNGPLCVGNPATITVSLTGTGPWNFTYTDGTTPTTVTGVATSPYVITVPLLQSTTTYSVTSLTDQNCTAVSAGLGSTTVTVNNTTTWTGNSSGDETNWLNAGNWTNCIPTRFVSAVIPNGLANYPELVTSATVEVNTLIVNSGATLYQSAGELHVYGNLSNSGVLELAPDNGSGTRTGGTLAFKGNTPHMIDGLSEVYNLTFDTGSTTTTLNSNLSVYKSLTMTSGLLSTNSGILITLRDAEQGPFSTATLSETETSYVLGRIAAIRDLDTPGVAASFNGLGLTLTPNAASTTLPGITQVVRTTGTFVLGANNNQSVLRQFRITPQNDDDLDVAMTFGFFNHERNGIADDNLLLFSRDKTATGNTPWAYYRSSLGTAMAPNGTNVGTVTLGSVASLGFDWTLGNKNAPLPVELTRFTAVREGYVAQLSWATATEKDNHGFEVQVSTDGRRFRTLGFVAGAGNSTAPRSYAFTDTENNTQGLRYYRLRQVDLDGSASFSPVRTLTFDGPLEPGASLTAAPNPFSSELMLTVTTPQANAEALLTLTDAAGRTVLARKVSVPAGRSELALPGLNELPSGLYLLHLPLHGQVYHTKVVKQ